MDDITLQKVIGEQEEKLNICFGLGAYSSAFTNSVLACTATQYDFI